jgi:hypothetical protein
MPDKRTKSPYELLRSKAILAILDGDTRFGEIDDVEISMPYLSGPIIVEFSQRFGLSATYGSGAQSRWAYLDDLIVHCIANNMVSDLLAYLFSKQQFEEKLRGKTPKQIDDVFNHITNTVIEQINGALYFGGNKLVVSKNKFLIIPIGGTVEVAAPAVKNIDREYIKDISDRAMQDIVSKNYDSAITKSRTLLEEVFCYVIEKKNETTSSSGDIGILYKQVKDLYNMHADKDIDRRINTLLSGLEKIVSSIAEMRNANSDAHGVGNRRLSIAEHHARLLVNSAMTMAEFVLSIGNNTK